MSIGVELTAERWQRINQLLELVKQEGDVESLQAMEDLVESCIAWRAFGIAWRNLVEGWDSEKLLQDTRARQRLEEQRAYEAWAQLREANAALARGRVELREWQTSHRRWFEEAKKAHAEAARLQAQLRATAP